MEPSSPRYLTVGRIYGDLGKFVIGDSPLEVRITAVLESKGSKKLSGSVYGVSIFTGFDIAVGIRLE